MRSVYLCRRI